MADRPAHQLAVHMRIQQPAMRHRCNRPEGLHISAFHSEGKTEICVQWTGKFIPSSGADSDYVWYALSHAHLSFLHKQHGRYTDPG